MKDNILVSLFGEFNKKRIKYCIRSRFRHLPKTLDGGDVDILIYSDDFEEAEKIIKQKGFVFYPFTEPNFFYYYYDIDLGLVQLDILVRKNFPKIKPFNIFFIPEDEKTIPNDKGVIKRILTGTRRRIHYLFRGKLVCFEGPDGSGKSTNVNAVYSALASLLTKKELVHFSTRFKDRKPGALKRAWTRSQSILETYRNIFLGRLTITDRYIYLTFRKYPPIFKKILLLLAPRPDLVFVMKARPETIRKRKIGRRDCLSKEVINELYELYENIDGAIVINTEKSLNKNVHFMVNKILEVLYRR